MIDSIMLNISIYHLSIYHITVIILHIILFVVTAFCLYQLCLFNSLPPGNLFPLFCRLLIFFKINFFEKFFQEYDQSLKQFGSSLSGLISAQTVCKSYQQATLGGKELMQDFIHLNVEGILVWLIWLTR